MPTKPKSPGGDFKLTIKPLTSERWPDLEQLFGPRGACAGCWCMWFRLKRATFDAQRGEGNRAALHMIVAAGDTPGLLAYADRVPVDWCAIAPREDYSLLERSRILKRVDDQPVWSVTCFFIAKPFRRKGLTVTLLKAAVQFAARHGAHIVEGYPVVPKSDRMPDTFAYYGTASAFRHAGFTEVLRRSETRPIMRFVIE
jgi:GNAT superfamily N-acetyltransferase